ncbi:hypothetical protein [Burkholderia cenocepacia]|uniref:hypothetical protein n=1 Tax=Burkholderia cenocepacia TaxID=95486 RepID=UPI00264DBCB7|nr:hypothetical protein [Burkholderia cenocepacia]MDN7540845.1 hypothetical protein [Burkholderia cenocepacia]
MDEIARGIGYAVIEVGGAVLLLVVLILVASKSLSFARACKVLLLLVWILGVTVVPVYGLSLTWQQGNHITAILAGILFIFPGPLPFFVIGVSSTLKMTQRQHIGFDPPG